MKKVILGFVLCLFFSSCGQSTNSNSYDEFLDFAIDPSNVKLAKAFNVVNSKCLNCHTGYHNRWKSFNTDAKWIESGVISAGNANASILMNKLKNDGGNMPIGGANLTEDEYEILKDWINNL